MSRSHELRMATDPEYFRQCVRIDHDGDIVPFVPDDWQEADFMAMDPAWKYAIGIGTQPQIQRGLFERPRGHSKSTDMGLMAAWALRYSPKRIRGIAAAGDRDQAEFVKNSIRSILDCNQFLKAEPLRVGKGQTITYSPGLLIRKNVVENPRTGSELEIISSDAGTSFGDIPVFIIVDEITHWDDTPEKAKFWQALLSTAAKKKRCVMVVICNAGFTEHWAYKEVHQKVMTLPKWHFCHLQGPRSTWITEDRLKEQESLLPLPEYERLWLNSWCLGTGDALSAVDINAAIKADGPMLGNEAGWSFMGGIDLAVKKDLAAVVVVGKHMYGGVRLAHVKAWKAPRGGLIDLTAVRSYVAQLHQQFRCYYYFDANQSILMSQDLAKLGVWMEAIPFQGKAATEMATAIMDLFTSRNITLYNDEELIADLRRLRLESKPVGYRLVADRTAHGHADRGFAFALAVLAATRSGGVADLPGDELLKAFQEEQDAQPKGQAAHERLRYETARGRTRDYSRVTHTRDDDEDSPNSGWERRLFR